MVRKPIYQMLITVLSLALLSACTKSPQVSRIETSATVQPQEPVAEATLTIKPTEIIVVPSPTEVEIGATQTQVIDLCTESNNPCECLGESYEHHDELGEIKTDYIGSWHAAPSVGSGYSERFVFFSSGNYLFFPSQYECDLNKPACTPSQIEEGIWGIQDNHMNLAKGGDIDYLRSISIGNVIDSSPEESPYPFITTFDGTTYWLISKDTNMWNPETGELCE